MVWSAASASDVLSSSISNMRSAAEVLARNEGLLDWLIRSWDDLDPDFGREGDWTKSSNNVDLPFELPEDFASRSWSRVCKDIKSILMLLLRAINSRSCGCFSIRSSSALPLFAIGRHANWLWRTTSSSSSIRSSSNSLRRLNLVSSAFSAKDRLRYLQVLKHALEV